MILNREVLQKYRKEELAMIKEYLKFEESGLHVVFGITQDKKIRLLHFSHNPFCEAEMQEKDSYLEEGFLLTQVSIYGIKL